MRQFIVLCTMLAACSGSPSPDSRPPAAQATATPAVTAAAPQPDEIDSAPAPLDASQLEGKTGPDIALHRVSDRIWLHLSAFDQPGWGRIEANGLIVFGSGGAVIIDTAWTPEQTGWLLDRVRAATGKDAVAMVATHSHEDRAGGAATAAAAGVPVYASTRTKALLGAQGEAISQPFDTTAALDLGDLHIELFYPGAGHAPDNIVVYVREERVLFGGCLVRAGHSNWIGNVADADLPAWPTTMDRVIERYGSARLVVPGHGRIGDASLLPHTRKLAENAGN